MENKKRMEDRKKLRGQIDEGGLGHKESFKEEAKDVKQII
jgi:hypothetical protein